MIRYILALLALTITAFAQDAASAARAAAGCGPKDVQFEAKGDKNFRALAQPEAGKALVYVIQDEKRDDDVTYLGHTTTRIGLDGNWVGANRGRSFSSFSIPPGEHRLCTDFQSINRAASKLGSALTFTAEAQKTYYFRAWIDERVMEPSSEMRLERVDPAEGSFLISNSSWSRSQPKK